MILQLTSLIIGFKILALLLGGLITYLAFKAYRTAGARSLGALSVGFGIITAGTFLAGVVNQVLGASFQISQLIESALIAVGFLVIVYSLYMTQP